MTAELRLLLNQANLETGIGNIQGSLQTGYPAADYHRGRGYRHLADLQRFQTSGFGYRGRDQMHSLGGSIRVAGVNPGALLTDICHLKLIRVQPRFGYGSPEGGFVHARRAGSDHNPVQV